MKKFSEVAKLQMGLKKAHVKAQKALDVEKCMNCFQEVWMTSNSYGESVLRVCIALLSHRKHVKTMLTCSPMRNEADMAEFSAAFEQVHKEVTASDAPTYNLSGLGGKSQHGQKGGGPGGGRSVDDVEQDDSEKRARDAADIMHSLKVSGMYDVLTRAIGVMNSKGHRSGSLADVAPRPDTDPNLPKSTQEVSDKILDLLDITKQLEETINDFAAAESPKSRKGGGEDGARAQMKTVQADLDAAKKDVESQSAEVARLQKCLDATNAKLRDAEAQIKELLAARKAQDDVISTMTVVESSPSQSMRSPISPCSPQSIAASVPDAVASTAAAQHASPTAASGESQQLVKELRASLSQAQAEIQSLKREIQRLKDLKDTLEEDVQRRQSQIDEERDAREESERLQRRMGDRDVDPPCESVEVAWAGSSEGVLSEGVLSQDPGSGEGSSDANGGQPKTAKGQKTIVRGSVRTVRRNRDHAGLGRTVEESQKTITTEEVSYVDDVEGDRWSQLRKREEKRELRIKKLEAEKFKFCVDLSKREKELEAEKMKVNQLEVALEELRKQLQEALGKVGKDVADAMQKSMEEVGMGDFLYSFSRRAVFYRLWQDAMRRQQKMKKAIEDLENLTVNGTEAALNPVSPARPTRMLVFDADTESSFEISPRQTRPARLPPGFRHPRSPRSQSPAGSLPGLPGSKSGLMLGRPCSQMSRVASSPGLRRSHSDLACSPLGRPGSTTTRSPLHAVGVNQLSTVNADCAGNLGFAPNSTPSSPGSEPPVRVKSAVAPDGTMLRRHSGASPFAATTLPPLSQPQSGGSPCSLTPAEPYLNHVQSKALPS